MKNFHLAVVFNAGEKKGRYTLKPPFDNLSKSKSCLVTYEMGEKCVLLNLASAAVILEDPVTFHTIVFKAPELVINSGVNWPSMPQFSWSYGPYSGQVVPPLMAAVYTRSKLMISTILRSDCFKSASLCQQKWEIDCALECASHWFEKPKTVEEKEIVGLLISALKPAKL